MEKQEFIKIKKQIKERMAALKEELIRAEKEYIESKKTFKIGQKVEITTPKQKGWTVSSGKHEEVIIPERKRYAFIFDYKIDYEYDVVPIYKKCKKDGSISKIKDYVNKKFEIVKAVK
jgi:hypothetical protein